MAYDQELAARIRQLIEGEPGLTGQELTGQELTGQELTGQELTEKKMFGGLAFLVAGNMAVAASGQGGVMIRVDPADHDELTDTTSATTVVMRGRPMTGWLRVSASDLGTDEQLAPWVDRGVAYARSLPPKG
jgi:hypothetical protein